MTTQKRTFGTVAASCLVGALVVAVCLGASALANGGFDALRFGGATQQQVETKEVVDSVGRTVVIPADAHGIASFDSFAGNVCVLIGAGEDLMGAPGGVKSNELLKLLYPQLESIAQLSGDSVNVETLLDAGSDVAIVRRSLYEGGDETAKLDKLGIPYVVVDYGTVEEQIEAIELIGEVCGGQASDKASQIADYYRSTVELVEERAATIPEEDRKAVYHSVNDALLTDGAGSLGDDWITRVGAVDVSAGEPGTGTLGDYTATLEQVYAWDPDVIICSTAATCEQIKQDAQWQGMRAVADGSVYNLPVSTSRWGQRGDPEAFLGMLWLGKTIYPQAYEDIDLQDTVCAYYRDVIGIDIDEELWEQILSGTGLRVEGNGGQGNADK